MLQVLLLTAMLFGYSFGQAVYTHVPLPPSREGNWRSGIALAMCQRR